MDTEGTKILNENQNKNEGTTYTKEEKKGSNIFGQGMATAAGAAVGTGAAMAADRAYEHYAASAIEEAEAVVEEDVEENAATPEEEAAVAEEPQAAAQEAPQHTVVEHVVTVRVEAVQPEPITASVETPIASDAEYVDDSNVVVAADTAEDNEVHVIGVAIQDNGQGGVATLAALQSGDDVAVVVDVESDGTIDFVGADINGNGGIESGEWQPVENVPFSTGAVIGTYVAEAQEQGAEPIVTDIDTGEQYQIAETENGYGLTSIDDSIQDDSMNTAACDEMPDYMNDADAGIMDA